MLFFFILITFFLSLKFSVYAEEAAQTLETQITISDGQDASVLKDQYVSSKLTLTPGTQITIESSSKIGSIYLIWDIQFLDGRYRRMVKQVHMEKMDFYMNMWY